MKENFEKYGFYPLKTPVDDNEEVDCVDSDGYLYKFSAKSVIDKRNLLFKRFMKKNPYKIQNMKRYVETEQPGSKLLSTDEEILSDDKLSFLCPVCKKPFVKKWCHWLEVERGKHTCRKCSTKRRAENDVYSYEQLKEIYKNNGYKLVSSYEDYLSKGRSHARLDCIDSQGYKYSVNVTNLQFEFSGKNKFSKSNPYAFENLGLYCELNDINCTIVSFCDRKSKSLVVKCSCGEEFITSLDKFMGGKTRCDKCSKVRSSLETAVSEWLKNHNIIFEEQYSFEDCRRHNPLIFDFYIQYNNQIILIETDGKQHEHPVSYFGGEEAFILQKEKDKIKEEYCKNKNYILIRINQEQIKNGQYKEILSKLF